MSRGCESVSASMMSCRFGSDISRKDRKGSGSVTDSTGVNGDSLTYNGDSLMGNSKGDSLTEKEGSRWKDKYYF